MGFDLGKYGLFNRMSSVCLEEKCIDRTKKQWKKRMHTLKAGSHKLKTETLRKNAGEFSRWIYSARPSRLNMGCEGVFARDMQ